MLELSHTLSHDDLVIASFTSGPGATTLPMKIYSMMRLGVTPEINAVSTILVDLVAVGIISASLIGKRKNNSLSMLPTINHQNYLPFIIMKTALNCFLKALSGRRLLTVLMTES